MHLHLESRALRISLALIVPIVVLWACGGDDDDDTSSGDVAAGKAAVTKYACATCHGKDLGGSKTPYAGTTATYPQNITPDNDTGIGEWDADTIKTAILTGKDDEGEQLCPTMPVFEDMNMTESEATNIVAYLKSIPAVSRAVPESECESGDAGEDDAGDPAIAKGKAAVAKYLCTSCHGKDLAGSTMPYTGTTTTYPQNITPDNDTGIGEWDADTIKTAILTGKDDEGEQLCPTMPIFEDMNMSETEASNIVAYLQSIPAVKKAVPESDCSDDEDAGN